MCLRNLFRRKVRTSLCVLGVALGIMLIVAIGATTTRYMEVLKEMNVFYSGNVVVVAKGSIFIQALPIASSLLEDTVNEVRAVEGVKAAVPMLFVIDSSASGGIPQLAPLNISVGVPVGNWSVLVGSTPLKPDGRWPSTDSGEKEVVVGRGLAQLYNLTVGSEIKLQNQDFKVVGVLDKGSVLLSRMIIMPLGVAQNVYNYPMRINMMVVKPQSNVTQEELGNRIEVEIPAVEALTREERDETIEPLIRDVETWNQGIGGVLFLISMVIVMTVAMMNISERRGELATMDAIGAPKGTIMRMVITETGLIGLFGGIAGTLLGVVAAVFLASFYGNVPLSLIFPDLFSLVSPLMMLEIIALTVVLSCIAGVMPALIVARRNIVEVLRSEN